MVPVVGVWSLKHHSAFSALRAYGLSSSKTLGLLVAALSLVAVGANLVSISMFLQSPEGPQSTDDL